MAEQAVQMSLDERWERLKPALALARVSTPAFGKLFMPHRFGRPFNSMHSSFFGLFDDPTKKRKAGAAPRGLGKTSSITIGKTAREVCFSLVKFVVVISATADKAIADVRNLAEELTSNPLIVDVFGSLKGPVWSLSEGNIITANGVRILARGAGQQIRGLLEGASRPDRIRCDDLEDPEPFEKGDPTKYLHDLKNWFFASLMNSIDVKRTEVEVVGTILHEDSLLANLLDDPEFESIRLELCDDQGHSNFPDYMDDAAVAKLIEAHEVRGNLDSFYREYRNLPVPKEGATFQRDFFRYWNQEELAKSHYDRVVIVDPANTVQAQSDYSALGGWGFDSIKNRIYQLDTIGARLYPEQMYEEAWQMARRLRTVVIGVETGNLGEFILYPFTNFLATKGYPPPVKLTPKGHKRDRIAQLAPLYRMGAIYHHPDKKIHGPLETQLLTFPRGKKDDLVDMEAYFIEMFNIGGRFFALPERDDEAAIQEELAMLADMDKEDSAALGPWRYAP